MPRSMNDDMGQLGGNGGERQMQGPRLDSSRPIKNFVGTENQYHRTTIVIDHFDDGTEQLARHETVYVQPPCSKGAGCRAAGYEQDHCEFDPKSGLCSGRMA